MKIWNYGVIFLILLQHMFITTPHPQDIVFKLIQRTKEAVRKVDHQNFKRLQKMLMCGDTELVPDLDDIESEPPRY